MKKAIKFLFSKPIYLVLIIILIIFLPTAISAPPEGIDRQHLSTVGIDLVDDGIELSILSHVSSQSGSFSKQYVLTSTIAPNIQYAFFQISSITGRKISLTHLTTIVVSQEVAESGLHNYLDYFYRNDNIANDTFVICTTGRAKDMLNFEKDRINSVGYSLEEVMVYNSRNTFFTDDNLESFYKGFFSPHKTSTIAIAELEDNEDGEQLLKSSSSNGSSNGGSNSGQKSSSTNQAKEQRIKNLGKLGILKAGKLIDILDGELVFGFNLASNSAHNLFLEIENFSDDVFTNVNIYFNIEYNNVSIKSHFENDKPIIEINTLTTLTLSSITGENIVPEYYENNFNILSDELKTAIEQKCKNKFSNFLKRLIEDKADIIGIYTILNNQQGDKFLHWLESLTNPDDYLANIEFHMKVNPALTT